jgi:hypothetical protein
VRTLYNGVKAAPAGRSRRRTRAGPAGPPPTTSASLTASAVPARRTGARHDDTPGCAELAPASSRASRKALEGICCGSAQGTVPPAGPLVSGMGRRIPSTFVRSNDWKAGRKDTPGSCPVGGTLTVTRRPSNTVQCAGRTRIYSDQSLKAFVKLNTPKVCAAIWTHFTVDTGYRFTVCADRVAWTLTTTVTSSS